MKKTIATTLTILSMLLILDSMNFGHALVMFYLAGVIPGTNTTVDASHMLEFFALVGGFVFARIAMFAAKNIKPHSTKAHQVHA